MKIAWVHIASGREPFAEAAEALYLQKLSAFFQTEILTIKAKTGEREQAADKRRAESAKLLEIFKPDDFVVLFDDKGQAFADSVEFSKRIVRAIESGKKRLVLVIGGAFGVDEAVRSRANLLVSLSHLTFNHHVARVVAMEQLYRALTIWKNLPYHNI